MRDVDGDAQIGITDRGAGSEIATYKEEGVHSLLSGNLMDVCPVGAITTRDYRFKSRPWDNPSAVDTICTLCSKGCNTTAWIKAKPEWAKGAQLDPHHAALQPGRQRLLDVRHRPLRLSLGRRRSPAACSRSCAPSNGVQQPVNWHDAWRALREPVATAKDGFHILTSAHASLEELHLLKQLAGRIGAPIAVSYTVTEKRQPAGVKFKVPAANAPNVNGARDLGLPVPADNATAPDLVELRAAVEAGQVKALYVFDPGPPGIARRHSMDCERSREWPSAFADRPGRGALRADGRRRLRPGWIDLIREGCLVHQRPGEGAGRGDRHRGAG